MGHGSNPLLEEDFAATRRRESYQWNESLTISVAARSFCVSWAQPIDSPHSGCCHHGPHLDFRVSEDRWPLQARCRGGHEKLLWDRSSVQCPRSIEEAARGQTSPLGAVAVGGFKVRGGIFKKGGPLVMVYSFRKLEP